MFKEMSKFQLGLLGVFIFFTLGGLVAFSLYKGGKDNVQPVIAIWGTVDESSINSYIQQVTYENKNKIRVVYVRKSAQDFDAELLEALATGSGPDVIIVGQDTVLRQVNKIYPVPYKAFSELEFKTAFIEEAELFLSPGGIFATPFMIDPMVMYWNRDIFTKANISLPPRYWDEFLTLAPVLTKRDAALNITESAVALGEYRNIAHAKDILSLLIIQAGNPIAIKSASRYEITFSSSLNNSVSPANSALAFYTQFANPLKSAYSWNRAFDDAKMEFLENKSGIYFGYASELRELRDKNPNLNFDVSAVPQNRPKDLAQGIPVTLGNIQGFAILKSSKNPQAAFNAVTMLTTRGNVDKWSKISGLPSVHRNGLTYDPSNSASQIFAQSALSARGWLDPDYSASEIVFKDMIESVTSGRRLYNEAVSDANGQLRILMDKVNDNLNQKQ